MLILLFLLLSKRLKPYLKRSRLRDIHRLVEMMTSITLMLVSLTMASFASNVTDSCCGPPHKGKLIWSFEFNTTEGIEKDWIQQKGGDGWGNHESQYYTDNGKNIKVVDENLEIETRKESYASNSYTSARLMSRKRFKYGVFEMRAKLPTGRGIWPAFWMLSTNRPLYWPEDGEIDIMEYVGYKPHEIFGSVHFGAIDHPKLKSQTISIANVSNWNLYQLDWSENAIEIYVNEKKYFHFNNDKMKDNSTWPFDHEFNVLINTAVGGRFGGAEGIDDSIFPQTYTIDYIRQYKREV